MYLFCSTSKTYLSRIQIRIRSDPVFLCHPDPDLNCLNRIRGSGSEKMDRIRNTGLNIWQAGLKHSIGWVKTFGRPRGLNIWQGESKHLVYQFKHLLGWVKTFGSWVIHLLSWVKTKYARVKAHCRLDHKLQAGSKYCRLV